MFRLNAISVAPRASTSQQTAHSVAPTASQQHSHITTPSASGSTIQLPSRLASQTLAPHVLQFPPSFQLPLPSIMQPAPQMPAIAPYVPRFPTNRSAQAVFGEPLAVPGIPHGNRRLRSSRIGQTPAVHRQRDNALKLEMVLLPKDVCVLLFQSKHQRLTLDFS